jgi:ribosomal protein L35AE/L33A
MLILQIEHEVLNFDAWKKAFEADPVNRKKSGVLGYKVFQKAENPNYVIVHLEFDNLKEAEDTLTALRKLWENVEGKITISPQTTILKLVESKVI